MEDFTALAVTCKHLNIECRDLTYSKLKKQKHAAHMMTCRLKKKLAVMELANKLLTVCWLRINQENKFLKNEILEYTDQTREI